MENTKERNKYTSAIRPPNLSTILHAAFPFHFSILQWNFWVLSNPATTSHGDSLLRNPNDLLTWKSGQIRFFAFVTVDLYPSHSPNSLYF